MSSAARVRKLTKQEALEFARNNIARMTLTSISKYTGWSKKIFYNAGIRKVKTYILKEPEYKGKTVFIPEWNATVKLHAKNTLKKYMKKVLHTREKNI
jgi:hypothetical protein